jgi:hypothetical protein
VRYPIILLALLVNKTLGICRIRGNSETKVLVWSKESSYRPAVGQSIIRIINDAQHLPFHEIDIGKNGSDNCATDIQQQELEVPLEV